MKGRLFFAAVLVGLGCSSFEPGARAAEEAPRAKQDEPGFTRFAGTLSPDGKYVLGWAPADLSKEALATLKEWDAEVKFNGDDGNVMNFLMDAPQGKVLMKIPGFAYFEGQGLRQNRHDLSIAWSANSRVAFAVYQGRWDDEGVVLIDAEALRAVSVEKQMLKAFYKVLREREKQMEEVSTQFEDAAILPGGRLVVSAFGFIPKEGPEYNYRLTFYVERKRGEVRMELLNARKLADDEGRVNSADPEPALNAAYEELRSGLKEKGRAALEAEEEKWLKWRESLPEAARAGVTAQRAALLRARVGR